MKTKITYRGKVHYWNNSFSTKKEAESFASKKKKQNYSVVIKKYPTPKKVGNTTYRYAVFLRSLPRK